MFTVNSPFRLMNSLVPSSGSTSQNRDHRRRVSQSTAADSSDHRGMPGASRGQAGGDDVVGGPVRRRQRRLVGLGFHAVIGPGVDLEDRAAGGARDREDAGQEAFGRAMHGRGVSP